MNRQPDAAHARLATPLLTHPISATEGGRRMSVAGVPSVFEQASPRGIGAVTAVDDFHGASQWFVPSRTSRRKRDGVWVSRPCRRQEARTSRCARPVTRYKATDLLMRTRLPVKWSSSSSRHRTARYRTKRPERFKALSMFTNPGDDHTNEWVVHCTEASLPQTICPRASHHVPPMRSRDHRSSGKNRWQDEERQCKKHRRVQ